MCDVTLCDVALRDVTLTFLAQSFQLGVIWLCARVVALILKPFCDAYNKVYLFYILPLHLYLSCFGSANKPRALTTFHMCTSTAQTVCGATGACGV